MRLILFASHLLQWRPLLPAIIELMHRCHGVSIKTTRPNWLGLPRFQMAFRPQYMTGFNKASLAWLAEKIGYGQEWGAVEDHVDYKSHFIPEEYDVAVSTTKDMAWLRDQWSSGIQRAIAVGYQHLPIVMRLNEGPHTYFDIPKSFWGHHAFADFHKFEDIYRWGTGRSCGFPHLDKVQIPASRKERKVLIQHPGGYRGIKGHAWLVGLVRTINDAGYKAWICPHFIPGWGYGGHDTNYAYTLMRSLPNNNWCTVDSWWDAAEYCDLILTTGSSAAYEMWAVGLTNVFILGYVGGKRHEKFQMFQDLLVESPEALGKLLRGLPGSAQATEPLTREVMAAYRTVHTGQGAKTAADIIEGA